MSEITLAIKEKGMSNYLTKNDKRDTYGDDDNFWLNLNQLIEECYFEDGKLHMSFNYDENSGEPYLSLVIPITELFEQFERFDVASKIADYIFENGNQTNNFIKIMEGIRKAREQKIEKRIKKEFIGDFRNDEGLRIRKNKMSPSLTSHGDSNGGIPVPMAISPTLAARKRSESDISTMPPLILRDGRDNRSCLREGRTLEVGFKGASIRRLTPVECERLQGFPNDWTKFGMDEKGNKVEISDTQRYKMCGNAVTVSVIEAIGRKLLEGFTEHGDLND